MQVCPSLLVKKDRGRPTDPKAKPKAYGEVNVSSNVPGVELLLDDDNNEGDVSDTDGSSSNDSDDDDHDIDEIAAASDDEENQLHGDVTGSEDDELEDDEVSQFEDEDNITDSDDSDVSDNDDDDEKEEEMEAADEAEHEATNGSNKTSDANAKKRKLSDFDGQLLAADTSLRALKRLSGVKMGQTSSDSIDGILSNEDFQRIKELKVYLYQTYVRWKTMMQFFLNICEFVTLTRFQKS